MGNGWPRSTAAATPERRARGITYSNQANLAAFTVASDDGITYVAGDVVLLTAQTTATEMGPWVVGTPAAGVAPLTRPSWWAAGASIESGTVIEVGGAGTKFGGTSWKVCRASNCTVGTHDPELWPRRMRTTITQSTGVAGQSNLGAGGDGQPIYLRPGYFRIHTDAQDYNADLHWAGTLMWWMPFAIVTGRPGTAACGIYSMTTVPAQDLGDTSVVCVEITNW